MAAFAFSIGSLHPRRYWSDRERRARAWRMAKPMPRFAPVMRTTLCEAHCRGEVDRSKLG
jgi:hypothetical protein